MLLKSPNYWKCWVEYFMKNYYLLSVTDEGDSHSREREKCRDFRRNQISWSALKKIMINERYRALMILKQNYVWANSRRGDLQLLKVENNTGRNNPFTVCGPWSSCNVCNLIHKNKLNVKKKILTLKHVCKFFRLRTTFGIMKNKQIVKMFFVVL